MRVLRSPTGIWKGKSREASIMAKKIHQPHISDGKVPVCTSQAAESEDESEEDQGENDVGSERADEVNQTQHAHKDEEEACC
jgi:hypothetical protein